MKKTLKYKDLKVGEVFRLKKVGRDFGLYTAVWQKNCEVQSTIVDKANYVFPEGSIVNTYNGMTHTIWHEAVVIPLDNHDVNYDKPKASFIKARNKKIAKRNDMLKNHTLGCLEELIPKKKGKKK
tara:strand:- start:822 stop:1196 length:375 start_codon:yes stop_codon:yes gene_type:complete